MIARQIQTVLCIKASENRKGCFTDLYKPSLNDLRFICLVSVTRSCLSLHSPDISLDRVIAIVMKCKIQPLTVCDLWCGTGSTFEIQFSVFV